MAVRSLPIDEASPIQVRAFATNFLNLDIPDTADDAAVLAAVRQASPNIATIFELVDENDAEEPAQQNGAAAAIPLAPEEFAGRTQGTLGHDDPRCLIQIPVIESEDGSGAQDVLVGVNGRAWQLKRGVNLDVPYRVVAALDNAYQHILRHDEQGNELRHDSKRYPYNWVGAQPSEQEIEAWVERTGAEFCA
jgi:hypothetical protein